MTIAQVYLIGPAGVYVTCGTARGYCRHGHLNRQAGGDSVGETDYVDSSGLGALIRLSGVLRAAGGGLKLCQLSPPVAKVIEITNLETLFHPYTTEAHAIAAFSSGHRTHGDSLGSSKTRIVCVDPSSNLLAGLNALLTRAGYEVFTTHRLGDTSTLVRAVAPASPRVRQ